MVPILAALRPPGSGPRPQAVDRLLLASEGRPFTDELIDLAIGMLELRGGSARVLSIARLWGTGLGLPHPGLRPTRQEMAAQEDNIGRALERFERAGVSADGHIVVTRHPRKCIVEEAKRHRCDAIVMGADPRRSWLVGGMMWSQEPYRVRGRAPMPVHLVCREAPARP